VYIIPEQYGPAAENKTINVTVLTNLLAPNGFHIVMCTNQNQNGGTFAQALAYAVQRGYVAQGARVVCDNARIHTAANQREAIEEILDTVDARLWLLPTYSPETNPCELIFAMCKNYVCRYRGAQSLIQEVTQGFRRITVENVNNFYTHCIHNSFHEF